MRFPKWIFWHNWTGWAIGWYPTEVSSLQLSLFYQSGYYINLDIMVTEKFDHRLSYKIRKPDNYLFPERRGFHLQ